MLSERIRITWRFWSDASPWLSYTSQVGNMTAANLQNSQASLIWRSSNTAPQEFICDFGQWRVVNMICVYNHNFSYYATMRLLIANDINFTEVVFDQTWDATDPLYGLGDGPLGLVGLGGYSSEGINLPFALKWFDAVIGRYAKIILTDSNNSAGYLQAGRLVVGDHWSPEGGNLVWGYESKLVSNSKQFQMRSGALRANRLTQQREMNVPFKFVNAVDERMLWEFIQTMDLSKDFFIDVYPEDNTINGRIHRMLGFLTEWSGFPRDNVHFRTLTFKVRESV